MKDKAGLYTILILFSLLVLKGISPCYAQMSDDIIYDTVWVYDTVWEYETVYDTVWEYETVYDTVYINDDYDPYAMVEPITISNLQFSSYYQKSKTFTKKEKEQPRTPVKRSVFSKLRYEFKSNRSQLRNGGWENNSDINVTLNPTKGKFDPRVFMLGKYSIDVFAGLGFQNTKYTFLNTESLQVRNNDSIDELPTLEYGLRINFNVFQYGIQTGVGVSQIRDEFNYIEHGLLLDPKSETFAWQQWQKQPVTDSVQNTDSAEVGVVHWDIFEYQKDVLVKGDSIRYYNDTILTKSSKTVVNNINLAEVPLVFSYEFALWRFGLLLKLGGVNQIYTFSKGKLYPYNSNKVVVDIDEYETFTKYNFAFYGGLGLNIKLNGKFGLVADAYYKHPLRLFSESKSALVHRSSFGVNAGIRYCF